ncbi:major facilitator superfamily domain-containing protein [Vararia minispora EC-137]|uniref:Major facilitator superfamily domain-containing protein n=1 Tax=Vararia minispora EC-137 TaxID=1314806 RepID=A0ACB8Q8P5_9AGAM|nr:major facilitator superfamily domain-containing protein [Vararia minispora EC-137]
MARSNSPGDILSATPSVPVIAYVPEPKTIIQNPQLPDPELKGEIQNASFSDVVALESSLRYDGGRQAWLTLIGGICAMTATYGYGNAFGVYQDRYVREGVASASSISWIGSIQIFLTMVSGIYTGPLVDRGYIRHMIFIGSVIFVFSLFMVSIVNIHHYYQLLLTQGIGMGIGGGLIYVPTIAAQSQHWLKHRPFAIGITFAGISLGGIIYPIMVNQMLVNGVSFAWTVRASAFTVLGLLVMANICIYPRRYSSRDSSVVSPIDGVATISFWSLFLDIPFILTNIGAFLGLLGNFYPYFYTQLYATTHGTDDTFAFYTLAILGVGAIVGRIASGVYAPTLGIFNSVILSGVCYAAVVFGLFGITTVAGITIYALLSGFFTGTLFVTIASAALSFTKSPAEAGMRAGLSFTISSFGPLIGGPINGALLGNKLAWNKTIIFTGASFVECNVSLRTAH